MKTLGRRRHHIRSTWVSVLARAMRQNARWGGRLEQRYECCGDDARRSPGLLAHGGGDRFVAGGPLDVHAGAEAERVSAGKMRLQCEPEFVGRADVAQCCFVACPDTTGIGPGGSVPVGGGVCDQSHPHRNRTGEPVRDPLGVVQLPVNPPMPDLVVLGDPCEFAHDPGSSSTSRRGAIWPWATFQEPVHGRSPAVLFTCSGWPSCAGNVDPVQFGQLLRVATVPRNTRSQERSRFLS